MTDFKGVPTLTDYLTGRTIPDIGAERHRQAVIRFLVEKKGYDRESLWMDAPICTEIAGRSYRARIDLIVKAGEPPRPLMAFKCCAGSLGSREREILAAARIFTETPIPLAVVSDGREAILLDTASGRPRAQGLANLPSAQEAFGLAAALNPAPYPEDRLEREKLIFRTYDQDNVNIIRPVENG
jgi:hypothetical protein